MKKLIITLFTIGMLFSKFVVAQNSKHIGLDISVHGYLFLTKDGLFFQPLDYFDNKMNFVSCLNELSFQINESTVIRYSDALKGVGNKLIVYEYYYNDHDTAKKELLKQFDTITYFKCTIDIGMHFFENDRGPKFREFGFGFMFGEDHFSYGNLTTPNQLLRINPDETKVLKEFYKSYQNKKLAQPLWLDKLYYERVIKKRMSH